MDSLLAVLQWLFPAGLSVWQVVLIRSYRRLNKARAVSDTRDVWQQIAESNNEALLSQNEQIKKLREVVSSLEAVVFKLVVCRHYDTCPAHRLVQEYTSKYHTRRSRQPDMEQKGFRFARDNTGGDGDPTGADGQPP
jgi:thioesterase domain-containing protein